MNLWGRVARLLIMGLVLVASGCGPMGGESEEIEDLSNKSLKVTHESFAPSGLTVAFDYHDASQCSVLDSDAFARLNGHPVPLFLGHYQYYPPQGDDGGFDCTHPSVTLDQIPPDWAPPWTIEIGDSSQIVSATFGPATVNAFDVGPATTPITSSLATLHLPIQRPPGDVTPAHAQATFTASDGQSLVRDGDVYQDYLQFLGPVAAGWPSGPLTAQVTVSYTPADVVSDCQNAQCSMAWELSPSGCGDPSGCSTLTPVSVTTALTLQVACPSANGICS